MDVEVTSLKESSEITKTTKIAEMEFCEGKLGEKHIVIVKCGMGKVNAGICAHTLINEFGCTKIINTGVAGSLDSKIDIGDIVVSTDAVQHDFTVEAIGFQKGEIPYTGLYAFPANEALRADAVKAVRESASDVHVFEGRVCSGDQFISTKEQKDKIISDKEDEINSILAVMNQFSISMSGLSFIDIIRGKHKGLINDFHDSIWVNVPMDQVQEVEKLPAEDDK